MRVACAARACPNIWLHSGLESVGIIGNLCYEYVVASKLTSPPFLSIKAENGLSFSSREFLKERRTKPFRPVSHHGISPSRYISNLRGASSLLPARRCR